MPKVLIIECEMILAYGLLHQFTQWGWQVLTLVEAKQTGLEKVRESLPDLIIINVEGEENLDGIENAWHIQHHYPIPFIFIHHQRPDRQQKRELRQISSYTWLCKPFTVEALRLAVHRLLPTSGQPVNACLSLASTDGGDSRMWKRINQEKSDRARRQKKEVLSLYTQQ